MWRGIGGEFPRTLDAALALPGIGRYTAAAVLSIAYDAPLAVLDGNVARVLARLGAIRGDLREPRHWRDLRLPRRITSLRGFPRVYLHDAPGDWNQALMELGETVCTPQIPRCGACPVARWCRARARRLTREIPAPRKKRAPVRVRIAAAILRDPRGRTLLVQDPGAHDDVLFSRMWQFPAVEVARDTRSGNLPRMSQRLSSIDAASLESRAAAGRAPRRHVSQRHAAALLARVEQLPKRAAHARPRARPASPSCLSRARRTRSLPRWAAPEAPSESGVG